MKLISLASVYDVYKQPIYVLLITPLQKSNKEYFHTVLLVFVFVFFLVYTIINRQVCCVGNNKFLIFPLQKKIKTTKKNRFSKKYSLKPKSTL